MNSKNKAPTSSAIVVDPSPPGPSSASVPSAENDVEVVMTDDIGSKRKNSVQNSKKAKKQRQDGSVSKILDPKINLGSKPGIYIIILNACLSVCLSVRSL